MVLRISKALAYFGGALLLLCAIVVTADIFLRTIFNIAPLYSFELAEFGFAAAVACGYGYALLTKFHIRIDVFYQRFPLRLRTALDVFAMAAMAVVVILLTYLGIEVAVRSFELGSRSQSTLGTPLFIPQGIWSLGLTWFAFICVYLLVKNVTLWLHGRHDDVSHNIGSTGGKH